MAPDYSTWSKRTLIQLNQQFKDEICSVQNETFTFLRELTDDKGTKYYLWKFTISYKWHKKNNSPIWKDDGTQVRKDIEKAEKSALHLANTFQPHPFPVDEIFQEVNNMKVKQMNL